MVDGEATRAILLKALNNAGKVLSGTEATLLFYFSGHGFRASGQNYLATYESALDDLPGTGLTLNRVQETLRGTGAKRIVMLIDACRDDPSAAAKSAGLRSFANFSAAAGLRALFSTGVGEVSYESGELQQGVFTYFLLRALSGEASGPDGLVTFQDVSNFVTAGVRDWGFVRKMAQVPYESTAGSEATGDFLLAEPGRTPASPRTPEAPTQRVATGSGEDYCRGFNRIVQAVASHDLFSPDPPKIVDLNIDPKDIVIRPPFFPYKYDLLPGSSQWECAEKVMLSRSPEVHAIDAVECLAQATSEQASRQAFLEAQGAMTSCLVGWEVEKKEDDAACRATFRVRRRDGLTALASDPSRFLWKRVELA